MSTSTAAVASSTSASSTRAFWERLWRTSGIQFIALFIIAYVIYGDQPRVGASADVLAAFYHGDRARILLAVVISGLNVLNLMWFAAALRTALTDAGQDGWGAAATAASAALGALFFLLLAVIAALAFSIAGSGNAGLISNSLFATGVLAVVLGVLGGTTWMTGGFWAPDGAYSRLVWPVIGLVWVMFVSWVLLKRSPAAPTGW